MATDHRSFSSSKNRKKPKFPRPKHKNDLKEEFKKLLAQHSEVMLYYWFQKLDFTMVRL